MRIAWWFLRHTSSDASDNSLAVGSLNKSRTSSSPTRSSSSAMRFFPASFPANSRYAKPNTSQVPSHDGPALQQHHRLRRRERRPRPRLDRPRLPGLRAPFRRFQDEHLHQPVRTRDRIAQVPPLRARRRDPARARDPEGPRTLRHPAAAGEEGGVPRGGEPDRDADAVRGHRQRPRQAPHARVRRRDRAPLPSGPPLRARAALCPVAPGRRGARQDAPRVRGARRQGGRRADAGLPSGVRRGERSRVPAALRIYIVVTDKRANSVGLQLADSHCAAGQGSTCSARSSRTGRSTSSGRS